MADGGCRDVGIGVGAKGGLGGGSRRRRHHRDTCTPGRRIRSRFPPERGGGRRAYRLRSSGGRVGARGATPRRGLGFRSARAHAHRASRDDPAHRIRLRGPVGSVAACELGGGPACLLRACLRAGGDRGGIGLALARGLLAQAGVRYRCRDRRDRRTPGAPAVRLGAGRRLGGRLRRPGACGCRIVDVVASATGEDGSARRCRSRARLRDRCRGTPGAERDVDGGARRGARRQHSDSRREARCAGRHRSGCVCSAGGIVPPRHPEPRGGGDHTPARRPLWRLAGADRPGASCAASGGPWRRPVASPGPGSTRRYRRGDHRL